MLTVDLHRHFEAGLRPETIARLAERNRVVVARTRTGEAIPGIDPQDPDSIRRYYRSIADGFRGPDGFSRFVDSFGLPLSVLCSAEDLEQAVFEQLVDCAAAGHLHTELRGSPFTYAETIAGRRPSGGPSRGGCPPGRGATGPRRSEANLGVPPVVSRCQLDEVASALVAGVDRAWRERSISGTFLLAFSRQKGERQARRVAELAARLHGADRPVGLDIAGFPEATYPPGAFAEALQPAREAGVPLTVHAGEQGACPDFAEAPPSLVVEAIEKLGARRIGHGTSLAASVAARALVRERGVGIECCPLSNECLGFVRVESHPLPLFLREALLASVGTDDPLMFGPFSVGRTLEALAGRLDLAVTDWPRLARNGLDTAFVSAGRRAWLHQRINADPVEGAML